jgi:hypothetical protein
MSNYNIINLTKFRELIQLLPETHDFNGEYGTFTFNQDKAILRTINRSHTVYIKITIDPAYFQQYEISKPNTIIVDQKQLSENNVHVDFNNPDWKEYSQSYYWCGMHKLDNELDKARYLTIPLKVFADCFKDDYHFEHVLVKCFGYESVFTCGLLESCLCNMPLKSIDLGLIDNNYHLFVRYGYGFMMVECLVASKLVGHDDVERLLDVNAARHVDFMEEYK